MMKEGLRSLWFCLEHEHGMSELIIEDCAKDGGFTFFAKDDGKKFLINKLRHSAAVATQNSSCSDKIPNDTLSKICLGHR